MNGYDKLELNDNAHHQHGARSKLDLLTIPSSKPFHHLNVRPLLRATTLYLIFHLTSPHSPAPGIKPLLPLTLVLGHTLSRRLRWTDIEVARSGSGLGVEGKRVKEYLRVVLDVVGFGAVCLAGTKRDVGGVLAGLVSRRRGRRHKNWFCAWC
jgi:hypothetical protein